MGPDKTVCVLLIEVLDCLAGGLGALVALLAGGIVGDEDGFRVV